MPRLFAAFALLLLALPALAQKDRVYFRDRVANKDDTQDGDVTETAAGVKVALPACKERIIPVADLYRVETAGLDPVPGRIPVQQAEAKGTTNPADALKFYTEAVKGNNDKAKRFLQYREAYWQGVVAAAAADKDFADEAKKAVDKMTAFVKAYPTAWEQWPMARSAARLAAELKDWKTADAMTAAAASPPDLPAELKLDAKLARIGYAVRAADYAGAKTLLAEAEGDKAVAGGLKDRLGIYKEALAVLPAKEGAAPTDAVAKIEKLISTSKDPAARSVGYGVLGEVYLAYKRTRQAQWSFHWVDVVYPNDQDEHVMALTRLVQLFAESDAKSDDKSQADRFRERLQKVR
jgi:hypothetical protein